jgi:hypothetical protein
MFGRSKPQRRYDITQDPESVDAANVLCQRAYEEGWRDFMARVEAFRDELAVAGREESATFVDEEMIPRLLES